MSFLPVRSERGACFAPCLQQLQGCRNREIKPVAGRPATRRLQLFRFRGKRFGLGNPAIGATRKSDLFTDLVRGVVIEFGELPVVEDAEIVELLLDRPRHAGELLEIVGRATRTCQALETDWLR